MKSKSSQQNTHSSHQHTGKYKNLTDAGAVKRMRGYERLKSDKWSSQGKISQEIVEYLTKTHYKLLFRAVRCNFLLQPYGTQRLSMIIPALEMRN